MNMVGKKVSDDEVIRPTKLFPTRNKVDLINLTEMNKLNTREVEYKIKYVRDLPIPNDKDEKNTKEEDDVKKTYTKEDIDHEMKYLSNNLICGETTKLKVGAQVMCVVNMELLNEGIMICNGSQGIITRFNENDIPVVKFRNGHEMAMNYHVWPSDKILGVGVSQIPLILAWAITIHKSQGATMDIAEIDVGSGVFECGQTYVALSRVKSLEGLYLTSFDTSKILINKKVREFYDALANSKILSSFS
jgi:ATP-dependent DNA helicase PIF1